MFLLVSCSCSCLFLLMTSACLRLLVVKSIDRTEVCNTFVVVHRKVSRHRAARATPEHQSPSLSVGRVEV